MGKPGKASLEKFKTQIRPDLPDRPGKRQFLTYYLIAAHPGCTEQDMLDLKRFTSQKLKINPEQVQIFTPTPSTYSSLMYYTEMDPFTRAPIFVEKDLRRKARQKDIVTDKALSKTFQRQIDHKDMEKLFAVCAPGLETFTALELNQLGLLHTSRGRQSRLSRVNRLELRKSETGGVSFTGDLKAIYRANLHLRTASRVLVRLGEFYAAAFSELRKKASRLAWGRYLRARPTGRDQRDLSHESVCTIRMQLRNELWGRLAML